MVGLRKYLNKLRTSMPDAAGMSDERLAGLLNMLDPSTLPPGARGAAEYRVRSILGDDADLNQLRGEYKQLLDQVGGDPVAAARMLRQSRDTGFTSPDVLGDEESIIGMLPEGDDNVLADLPQDSTQTPVPADQNVRLTDEPGQPRRDEVLGGITDAVRQGFADNAPTGRVEQFAPPGAGRSPSAELAREQAADAASFLGPDTLPADGPGQTIVVDEPMIDGPDGLDMTPQDIIRLDDENAAYRAAGGGQTTSDPELDQMRLKGNPGEATAFDRLPTEDQDALVRMTGAEPSFLRTWTDQQIADTMEVNFGMRPGDDGFVSAGPAGTIQEGLDLEPADVGVGGEPLQPESIDIGFGGEDAPPGVFRSGGTLDDMEVAAGLNSRFQPTYQNPSAAPGPTPAPAPAAPPPFAATQPNQPYAGVGPVNIPPATQMSPAMPPQAAAAQALPPPPVPGPMQAAGQAPDLVTGQGTPALGAGGLPEGIVSVETTPVLDSLLDENGVTPQPVAPMPGTPVISSQTAPTPPGTTPTPPPPNTRPYKTPVQDANKAMYGSYGETQPVKTIRGITGLAAKPFDYAYNHPYKTAIKLGLAGGLAGSIPYLMEQGPDSGLVPADEAEMEALRSATSDADRRFAEFFGSGDPAGMQKMLEEEKAMQEAASTTNTKQAQ